MLGSCNRYATLSKLGEGAFGTVHKAIDGFTGRKVAIKRVYLRKLNEGIPPEVWREVKCLQELDHGNVVQLQDVFAQGGALCLVLEYLEGDLSQIIRLGSSGTKLTAMQVGACMYMILSGAAACHARGIIHRDLKPSNILVSQAGELKIGDFGLATLHNELLQRPHSHRAATRWYRAPELLFGARVYGAEVDVWSIGCIFAELYNMAPLFTGENDIDQLFRIFCVLGTVTDANWRGAADLPDFHKIEFDARGPRPWFEVCPTADASALSLLAALLCLAPTDRIHCDAALHHTHFMTIVPCTPSDLPTPKPLPEEPCEPGLHFVTDERFDALFRSLVA